MGKSADKSAPRDGSGAYEPSYPKNDGNVESGVGPSPSTPSYSYPGYSAAPTANPSQAGWVGQPGQQGYQQYQPQKSNSSKIVIYVVIGIAVFCCCCYGFPLILVCWLCPQLINPTTTTERYNK